MKRAGTKSRPEQLALGIAGLLGVIMLVNGLVMLWNPWWWYLHAPGVRRTGLFNPHFVRDIGYTYALIGGAFLAGIVRSKMRLVLWAPPALWLTCHALFHFWEVGAGLCGPEQLATDFPAVTLPALIGIGLTIDAWRRYAAAIQDSPSSQAAL